MMRFYITVFFLNCSNNNYYYCTCTIQLNLRFNLRFLLTGAELISLFDGRFTTSVAYGVLPLCSHMTEDPMTKSSLAGIPLTSISVKSALYSLLFDSSASMYVPTLNQANLLILIKIKSLSHFGWAL